MQSKLASSVRNVAVLTVGRSDFGRYRPILKALLAYPNVDVSLLASGNHFDERFGCTISEIRESGFDWITGLDIDQYSDSPRSVGRVIADGTQKLADYFEKSPPDLLVLLGDRFEMLSGASAALGFSIPIVHIHGGAVTEGAIDELVRHALTKMSHIHLVSCDVYESRLKQLGEEDWRIHVTGAPGLDELKSVADMSLEDLSGEIGLKAHDPFILGCLHPETVSMIDPRDQVSAFLTPLKHINMPLVLTYPNADQGSAVIVHEIEKFSAENSERVCLLKNAGTRLFTNMLANATAIVGNSSSGIVEAPTFKVPVVNIGIRQDGKIKTENVIDVRFDSDEILRALETACSKQFRKSLEGLVNPYGDGRAGERIAEILASIPIDQKLLHKRFVDI